MARETLSAKSIDKEKGNIRQILDIVEQSRNLNEYPEDVVFLHGTSTNAIKVLIEKGALPARAYATKQHKSGDVFVFPLMERFSVREPQGDIVIAHGDETVNAREEVARYAGMAARKHYLLSYFGLPLNDPYLDMALNQFVAGKTVRDIKPTTSQNKKILEAMRVVIGLAGSEEQLAERFAEANTHRGVVIGIKRSALNVFDVAAGDTEAEEGDLKLGTGRRGLRLSDIGYIEFLGAEGLPFIDELKAKL